MNERFDIYLDSLLPDAEGLFAEMEEEAKRDRVPILRRPSAAFLRSILRAEMPERILEIGTAIGYSALLMHEVCPQAEITTLELDPQRAERARTYFDRAGAAGHIRLIPGDAAESLKMLEPGYGFIFSDGPKGQIPAYFPMLDRLLKPGGILLTDNILQENTLLDSRFSVERRDRTIHERLRGFVRDIFQNDQYENSLLPLGDGMLLSVKRKA